MTARGVTGCYAHFSTRFRIFFARFVVDNVEMKKRDCLQRGCARAEDEEGAKTGEVQVCERAMEENARV